MKRLHPYFWFSAVLLPLIFSGVVFAQDAMLSAKAVIRLVHGNVAYSTGNQWRPLKANQELVAGTTIRAESNSDCYLQVTGFTSTVKVTEKTTLVLQKMTTGKGFGSDTETILNLKTGKMLASVRKLSAGSSYKVLTPNGTMEVRGTDFQISAEPLASGAFRVTFTSVTGQILCSATIAGKPVTKLLTSGESWTPGEPDPPAVKGPVKEK